MLSTCLSPADAAGEDVYVDPGESEDAKACPECYSQAGFQ